MYKKSILLAFLALFLLSPFIGRGQIVNLKEEVESHLDADPLTISGDIGGEMNSSWNNQDVYGYTDPFAFAAYANFDIGIFGFHMPININLLNLSMTQFTFPHPQININTTPEWKNWRLHLGTSSMHFNNYTYSGLSFTGVGLEYNGEKFRVAGFNGFLNRETRFRDDRSAMQYFTDSLLGINQQETTAPQFRRRAWGGRIGVGSSKTFIDLSVMKSMDDLESLPVQWMYDGADTITYRDSVIRAKENFTAGLSGRLSIGEHLSFDANVGMSLYTDDLLATELTKDNLHSLGADTSDAMLKKLVGVLDKMRGLYNARTNSQVRFAGDAGMNLVFDKFNASVTYRFVQADYTSLGSNQISQNAEGIGATANWRFLKNRSLLNITAYMQNDNLDGRQMYTNQVATYSANWSFSVNDNLDIAASYSGLKQDQKDGLMIVNDTTRINQIMHSITVSPSYTIYGDNEHTLSVNFNNIANKNLNKLSNNNGDVNTLTFGVGYDCSLTESRLSFGGNYDFSNSSATMNSYKSHTLSGNLSYNAISKDDLTLRLSASLALSYNVKPEEDDYGYGGFEDDEDEYDPDMNASTNHTTNDFSFNARMGLTFNYKDAHNASLFLTTSNYSENIVFGQKISTTVDLRLSVAYSYNFSKTIIKSKRTKKEDESEENLKEGKNEPILR